MVDNIMTTNDDSVTGPVLPTDNQVYQFKPYSQDDDCDLNPEFAVICSFISHFSEKLDLKLNIEQLKSSIEDQDHLDEGLIDLHVKLLKKVRRYFVRDQWEKVLIRFTSEYSYEDAYELEVLGYMKTRPSIKLQLLRRLMEAQFECDQKFKSSVNLSEASELRILPIGRDVSGNTYWQRTDQEGSLRIFREQPLDYKSWKTVCTSTQDLDKFIDELETSKDVKIKGEPITEPYNPLPELFPEFFNQEKEPEEAKLTDIKVSKPKKGRAKAKNQKANPLPPLKEVKEEEESKISSEKLRASELSVNSNDQSNSKNISNLSAVSDLQSGSSEESQVKTTLENLIGMVVSSFEYIIRPVSRNSSPQNKEQTDEVKDQRKTKKRSNKRDKPKEETLPRRTSSRIQQIQMKKIAEQEEEMKKMLESNASKKAGSIVSLDEDSRSHGSSSRNNKRRSESPEDDYKSGKRRRNKGQSWKRGKGKKKLSWDKDDSDLSSTSSLTESNDDDLDDVDDSFKFDTNNYDDEFACEDEETNAEPVITKRARTARQSLRLDEQFDPNINNSIEEDKPCGRCDKSNDPEWILLCDMCDDGYHTSCCLPPLMIIPDGDWFCPSCEHKTLLIKLKDLRTSIKEILDTKERERKKNQRLRQTAVKKEQVKLETHEISSDKQKTDYIHELDEPLTIQNEDEEMEETSENESDESFDGRTRKRQKKATKLKKPPRKSKYEEDTAFKTHTKRPRKTYSRRKVSESDESDDGTHENLSSSSDEIAPKARRARASVSYRFKEYDDLIKSAIHGDSYDEEESRAGSVADCSNYGRGKDMATIEALAYKQENGITEDNVQPVEEVQEANSKSRNKKKSRRLNDLDAASESENTTSDESFQATSATEAEDEDDDLTEADTSEDADASMDELVDVSRYRLNKKNKKKRKKKSSIFDSDDSDYQPTRTRRAAAAKQVSYKESSDEDDSETVTTRKAKKDVLSSDDDSQASWKSHAASVVDDDRSTSCAESPELKINETPYSNERNEDNTSADSINDKQGNLPSEAGLKSSIKQDVSPEANSTRQAELKQVIPSIDTSIDEIVVPVQQSTIIETQVIDNQIKIKKLERVGLPKVEPIKNEGKIRDPIQELNQYCSESANSASMFNSYNETLKSKSSPIHPAFYEEDDLKTSSSIEKPKRTKKPKATVRPFENPSGETLSETVAPERRAPPILSTPILERATTHVRPKLNSPPRHPTRSLTTDVTTTSPRFQNTQPHIAPQVYSMHPSPITYQRNIYPNKYAQQHPPPHPPPQNQVHHYPHSYDSHLNNFIQQTPRPSIPINPYNSTHLQGGMWNPNSVPPGTSSRQPVPTVYYSSNGPLPNPNFSIHQLLGNPYSMTGLAPPPNVPTLNQLPPTVQNSQSGSISHQVTPTSTQSSINSDSSTSDTRLNADKDMIRGMSDVISFIGDT